jgi:hypothetical protein
MTVDDAIGGHKFAESEERAFSILLSPEIANASGEEAHKVGVGYARRCIVPINIGRVAELPREGWGAVGLPFAVC